MQDSPEFKLPLARERSELKGGYLRLARRALHEIEPLLQSLDTAAMDRALSRYGNGNMRHSLVAEGCKRLEARRQHADFVLRKAPALQAETSAAAAKQAVAEQRLHAEQRRSAALQARLEQLQRRAAELGLGNSGGSAQPPLPQCLGLEL
eukprot:SAG22_NODE_5636_length_979_cov_1.057955_1_plen_150_part_00